MRACVTLRLHTVEGNAGHVVNRMTCPKTLGMHKGQQNLQTAAPSAKVTNGSHEVFSVLKCAL